MSDTSNKNQVRKLRILRVDTLKLAIPEDRVTTVIDWNAPAPLPFAPESVLGVVCIHGRMFTVLNVTKLLNAGAQKEIDVTRSIVALRGDEQLALAVDLADVTIAVDTDEISPPSPASSRLVQGAIEHDGDKFQLLDVDELFQVVLEGRERRRRRY